MTSITLTQKTQDLVKAALSTASGNPGTNNANYIAAYNAVSAEIAANGNFNSGTSYWFSQAGAVNSQYYQSTPAGNFIWTYTQAAAASYGVTVTPNQLLQASNQIALTVFQQIQNAGYQISDDPNMQFNFSPASIVKDDAGAGIAELNDLNGTSLDDSIWGGTLFARTTLNDPTYFTDNGLNLIPGSADCVAITSGVVAATNPASLSLFQSFLNGGISSLPSNIYNSFISLGGLDEAAIKACFPSSSGSLGNGNSYAVNSDGSVTIGNSQNGSSVLTTIGDGNSFLAIMAQNIDGTSGFLAQAANAGSSPVGVDQTSSGGLPTLSLSYANGGSTLSGSFVDPTQLAYVGNGAFTVGSSQPDASGYTNQLSLAATTSFDISGLNVTDPTTGQTSSVALNNGSSTDLQEGRSVATGAPNEQVQSTGSDGSQQDTIFGQGAQANVSNTAVTLAPGTQAAVAGNNDKVSDDDSAPVQEGRSVAISGQNNTYTGQAGDNAQLAGTGNSVNNVSAGLITIADGSTNITVNNGNGDTIDAGQGTTGNYTGANNILNLSANSGSYAGIYGTNETITGDSGTNGINVAGVGTSVTVDGGGYVGIIDSGDHVTLDDSGDNLLTAGGISGIGVIGSGYTLGLAGGDSGTFGGNGFTLDMSSGNLGEIQSGTSNVVNNDVAGNGVNLDSNTQTTITGSGGYFGITGTNVDVNASGETSYTWAGVSFDLQGAGNNVDVGGGSSVTLGGSGNTLNLSANSGSYAGIYGTNETITGDSGTNGINVAGVGTSVTVDGGGYVGIIDSGDHVTLDDSGDNLLTAGGISGIGVIGSGYTLGLAGGDSGTFGGNGFTLDMSSGNLGEIQSGTSNVVNNDVAGNGVNLDSNTQTTITGSGGYFGITGTNVDVNASGETSYTWAGVSFDLQGAGNNVDVGGGSSVTLGGSGNTLNLSANSDSYAGIYGTNETITGDSGTNGINVAGVGTSVTVDGGGYVGIIDSGDHVTLDDSGDNLLTAGGISGIGVIGSGYTLGLAGGDSGTFGGNGFTLDMSSGNLGEIQSGTSNVVNNDVAGNGVNLDSNTQTTITGSGGYFGITGTNVDVNASGETSYTWAGVSFDLQGTGNNVDVGGGSSVTLGGANNTLNLSGNSGSYAAVFGTNQTITGDTAGNSVNVYGDGTSTTIGGAGGYVGILGSNDSVTLGDGGDNLLTAGGISGIGVIGSGYTLGLAGGDSGNFSGNGNTINLTGDGGDYAGISGTGNVVTGDSGTNLVNLIGTGTSATVYGTGAVGLTASNQTLTLETAGSDTGVAADATGETIDANNDIVYQGLDGGANIIGDSNTIFGGSGSTDTIVGNNNIFSGNDATAYVVSSNTSFSFGGLSDTIELEGTNQTVIFTGTDQKIILPGSGQAVSTFGDIITSTDNYSVELDNTSGQKIGEFGFTNGYESSRAVFDPTGETEELDFNSAGAETLDALFNSSQQNYETFYFSGNPNNDFETDQASYNSSGVITSDYLFNSSSEYSYALLDYTGTPGNDYVYSQYEFNSSGAETTDALFNSQGQNYETYYFSGNPYNNYETMQADFNAADAATLIAYFDSNYENYATYTYSGVPGDDTETGSYYDDVGDYGNGDSGAGYDGGDDDGGDDGEGDDDGGDDFATATAAFSTSNDVVAQYDSSVAQDKSATSAALISHFEAAAALTGSEDQGSGNPTVSNNIKWESSAGAPAQVITWSFASQPGSAADPFSGFISSQYEATVQKAIAAWSAASGLAFVQVADSSATDIRIGWGDFETQQSGVLGYTSYQQNNGAIQPGAIIRLEDPTENAIVLKNGDDFYQGTDATLYQVALHEIGRALGFSDNSDQMSVLYPVSGQNNRQLDPNDAAGAQSLYTTNITTETTNAPMGASAAPLALASAAGASGLNQMIQAMAAFSPQVSSTALPIAAQNNALATQLAAPLHQ